MILLSEPIVSEESQCPYIEGKMWRFTYFFAREVLDSELSEILARGWRKFGFYYFKPVCHDCNACIPIRLRTDEFRPTKSQRRVKKKCSEIRVQFNDLEYRDEIFEIYKDHSMARFGKKAEQDDFINSFYLPSCPAIQSEYFIEDKLMAVGFLDLSSDSLSSIYFIYNSDYLKYSPGTMSVIKETEYAASLGLSYYYLGYYINENTRMSYKNSFHVNEKMDWSTGQWIKEGISPE